MKTNKLTIRNPGKSIGIANSDLFILLFVAGFLFWFLTKKKSIQFKNLERWEIIRDDKGFAKEIIVHRDASER